MQRVLSVLIASTSFCVDSHAVSGPTVCYTLSLTMRNPSLTLTQFCALLKTMLLCRAYETPPWRLRDSSGCKKCCANTYLLAYLFWMIHIAASVCGVDSLWVSCTSKPSRRFCALPKDVRSSWSSLITEFITSALPQKPSASTSLTTHFVGILFC